MTAQPHRFSIPLEQMTSEYERSLRAYTDAELLDELQANSYDIGAGCCPGLAAERIRECRRELARRNPGLAA